MLCRPPSCSFVLLAWAGLASAYPEYIAKGYTNCATCHYSPTGGGLANSYGHGTTQATFPDAVHVGALAEMRRVLMKRDVTGYDDRERAALQWDVGLHSRLMFLRTPTQFAGKEEVVFIPMLAEVSGVLAWGPASAYASVTPRRAGTSRYPDTAFSREHWLKFKIGESMSLRAGRMALPFGLRIPDHTQYVREDFGFDKWGQSYALEVDTYADAWAISAAGFVGDLLLAPRQLQQRGGAVSVAFNVPSRAVLGASARASLGETAAQVAATVFLRLRLLQRTYVMAEASGQRRWAFAGGAAAQLQAAGYLRLGWFAMESLEFYVEWGGRGVLRHSDVTKLRYGGGANWHVLPWVEVEPALVLEEDVATGLDASGFFQVAVTY